MTITVECSCGTRVRGEPARLRRHPPCPNCGKPLSGEPEPKERRKIPFQCLCGLEMAFPWSRGGLWFECPECGRKSIIPGRVASVPRRLPVDLPPEARTRRSRVPVLVALAIAAIAAAVAVVVLG